MLNSNQDLCWTYCIAKTSLLLDTLVQEFSHSTLNLDELTWFIIEVLPPWIFDYSVCVYCEYVISWVVFLFYFIGCHFPCFVFNEILLPFTHILCYYAYKRSQVQLTTGYCCNTFPNQLHIICSTSCFIGHVMSQPGSGRPSIRWACLHCMSYQWVVHARTVYAAYAFIFRSHVIHLHVLWCV